MQAELESRNQGWKYFTDDFDPENVGSISLDKFEKDFSMVLKHIKQLVYIILNFIDDYCKREMSKCSLKDELIKIQRQNM